MKYSRYFLILFIFISFFSTYTIYNKLKEREIEEINYITAIYAERLKNEIDKSIQATNMLKQVVLFYKGQVPEQEYPLFAQLVYNDKEHISINFLPDGILTYSYPEELNEGALGYNVLENPLTNTDALKTKALKKPTLSGPYIQEIPVLNKPNDPLKVPVIVARNPVYINQNGSEKFWGFISIDINPSHTFLSQIGISDEKEFPYEYKIDSIYKGQKVELGRSSNFNNDDIINLYSIDLQNGEWTFSMYHKGHKESLYTYAALVLITFIALSFGLFSILRFYEIKSNRTYALSLIDTLTELNNKKALNLYAEQFPKGNVKGFSLIYIDLNGIKTVNESYGHTAGDLVLQNFAGRLTGNFSNDAFIARVGGDDFVILVFGIHTIKECQAMRQRVKLLAENTFYIHNHQINLSAYIGMARYPHDSNDFYTVLDLADKEMLAQRNKTTVE